MKKQIAILLAASAIPLCAAPIVDVALPERFRVLSQQMFDFRVEATGLINPSTATVKLIVDGVDSTANFGTAEITTDNDNNASDLDKAWVFRSISFVDAGVTEITVEVTDNGQTSSYLQRIGVQEFKIGALQKKNVILYIGDAMGTAYRDVGRIVAKSENNGFRGGFFDELQQMDQMPYSGMVMTYAEENIVPDSANTASAWANGNKTINGALNTFPDNNDWKAGDASKLDNPRFETLWSYLKRLHGYKTGIVSTAEVTDATPAAEGAYSIQRALKKDIARQFVDGSFSQGPVFDVILGGAKGDFDGRSDGRNLITELVGTHGFTRVDDRTQLNNLSGVPDKLVGLFCTGNMTVAYDKLGLLRPSDEPTTFTSSFPNQPMLEEMTAKAIATLSKGNSPFILMVEGASVDKQSHSNHAAGTLWDVIELDKAIGVGRAFAKNTAAQRKTLTLVSADHDQSMHILGVVDTNVPNATQNVRSGVGYTGLVGGVSGLFTDYSDTNSDGYPDNTNRYRVSVGFRTGDHTGSTVPITAEGPGSALFSGVFDQTDIFFKMAKVISSNTTALDEFEKAKAKLKTIDPNY